MAFFVLWRLARKAATALHPRGFSTRGYTSREDEAAVGLGPYAFSNASQSCSFAQAEKPCQPTSGNSFFSPAMSTV